MELSARWGRALPGPPSRTAEAQALFGIQQGPTFEPLLRGVVERLQEIGFDGYAIGGLRWGRGTARLLEVLVYAPALLPAERPGILMGVGTADRPRRSGGAGRGHVRLRAADALRRHGQAWTWNGPINLKNARFAEADEPLDAGSAAPPAGTTRRRTCTTCSGPGEILGQVLLSWHNLAFYAALTGAMRSAIAEGRSDAFRRDFAARQEARGGGAAA
jgi:queuine tRNA-ribosyltransferase